MLYPLKFHPILKKKIWGGERLSYKSEQHEESIGESWEISAVEDNISVVSNGILADNDLQELIEVYMGDLVGDRVYEKFGVEFPLLIKYIDANDDLSIQVHPDDETAKERHNAYGKTEMWYVADVEKDASLIMGFNKATDKAEYLQALHSNRLMDILNTEKVKKGDSFFIPAGLVHAIGKGCYIAEIQQTSDITYRIYDYNRKDAEGHTRELHTDLATDVIDYHYYPKHKVDYTPHDNKSVQLVKCPYFTTNLLVFDRDIEKEYVHLDSFVIYMCIQGKFTISTGECEPVMVNKGETVLVPACFKNVTLYPDEVSRVLEIYVEE
ncbi:MULTISPECIES: type I phosphomannose isomerase catalytic subunit [Butyricimonas]|uniref:type I phosphomannose isomerase catalytic subunit n=1 Tax=Butyricimonas TaxID=574697 RepID=UPI001D07E044|nr:MULTISPECIES: type I phosphomannose isomerase catalytic subunit [Butyricimonas]MCB6974898.1 class I mannose-6-phosphate isomerase [Butyricimonas synergistica]MCG4521617.1 class I mannose-6-phosphate isomerase [Butyricimonas sp. DFI.6.44]